MLGRQERTAFILLILVAMIVLAGHVILNAAGKQPFAHPFTNATADGDLVFHEGTIEKASFTKTGGHVTLWVNNVTVFIPAQAVQERSFQKGQNISLYGTVTHYRGEKEIIVNEAGDLHFQ